jgi:hypothetical protein
MEASCIGACSAQGPPFIDSTKKIALVLALHRGHHLLIPQKNRIGACSAQGTPFIDFKKNCIRACFAQRPPFPYKKSVCPL